MKLIQLTVVGPVQDDPETLAEVLRTVATDVASGDKDGVVGMMTVDGGSAGYEWEIKDLPDEDQSPSA